MPRAARDDYVAKTLRMHAPSYKTIQDYCNPQLTGIYAANVLDVIIQSVAGYFKTRLEHDEHITHQELANLPKMVYDSMDALQKRGATPGKTDQLTLKE